MSDMPSVGSYPNGLAALLADDRDLQTEALKTCRTKLEGFDKLQEQFRTDTELANLVDAWGWTTNAYVMENLTSLREYDFSLIPPETGRPIKT